MEEYLRRTAIRRYVLGGERPKTIYSSLSRSKKWFFKWLKRYQTGGTDWHKDKEYTRSLLNKPVTAGTKDKYACQPLQRHEVEEYA